MGFKPTLSLQQGENAIELSLLTPPKKVETKYGDRYVYDLKEPEGQAIMASAYLHAQIVRFLVDGGSPKMRIVRTGEKTETRYDILPAKE